jgi:hypothetical protein
MDASAQLIRKRAIAHCSKGKGMALTTDGPDSGQSTWWRPASSEEVAELRNGTARTTITDDIPDRNQSEGDAP